MDRNLAMRRQTTAEELEQLGQIELRTEKRLREQQVLAREIEERQLALEEQSRQLEERQRAIAAASLASQAQDRFSVNTAALHANRPRQQHTPDWRQASHGGQSPSPPRRSRDPPRRASTRHNFCDALDAAGLTPPAPAADYQTAKARFEDARILLEKTPCTIAGAVITTLAGILLVLNARPCPEYVAQEKRELKVIEKDCKAFEVPLPVVFSVRDLFDWIPFLAAHLIKLPYSDIRLSDILTSKHKEKMRTLRDLDPVLKAQMDSSDNWSAVMPDSVILQLIVMMFLPENEDACKMQLKDLCRESADACRTTLYAPLPTGSKYFRKLIPPFVFLQQYVTHLMPPPVPEIQEIAMITPSTVLGIVLEHYPAPKGGRQAEYLLNHLIRKWSLPQKVLMLGHTVMVELFKELIRLLTEHESTIQSLEPVLEYMFGVTNSPNGLLYLDSHSHKDRDSSTRKDKEPASAKSTFMRRLFGTQTTGTRALSQPALLHHLDFVPAQLDSILEEDWMDEDDQQLLMQGLTDPLSLTEERAGQFNELFAEAQPLEMLEFSRQLQSSELSFMSPSHDARYGNSSPRRPALTLPPPKSRKESPCFGFLNGTCDKGDACMYSHHRPSCVSSSQERAYSDLLNFLKAAQIDPSSLPSLNNIIPYDSSIPGMSPWPAWPTTVQPAAGGGSPSARPVAPSSAFPSAPIGQR